MVNANQILGEEAFKLEDWRVIGEYVYDEEGGRHQAFYSPVKDVTVLGQTVKAHERIQVEQSLKYSQPAATKLWNTASLEEVDQWTLGDEYGKSKPSFVLSHNTPVSLVTFYFFQPVSAEVSYDTPRSAGIRPALVIWLLLVTGTIPSNPCLLGRQASVKRPRVGLGATRYKTASRWLDGLLI